MAESSYMIAPGETSDNLSMRKKLALALAQKNLEPVKVDHWAQGLAHLGDQAYSGYEIGKINKDEKDENAKANALMVALWNGGQAPGAAQSPTASAEPVSRPAGVATPMGDALKNYKPADPTAPSVPVATDPGAPVNTPRPEVMPSAKVWGDKEAEAAGLYEPTGATKPAFNDRYAAVAPTAPVANDAAAPKPVQTQKFAQALQQPAAAPAAPAAAPGVNREAVIQMLNNPKTRPMAQSIISSEINQRLKPETTDEIKEYNLYKRQGGDKDFFNYKAELKKAGAVNVNTNVGGGTDKQIFDTMDESAKAARATATGLTGLREARAALEGGAITGFGANQMLDFRKLGSALGLANSDKIVNTETFRAAIAPQVAAVMKSTVGTTNISNSDREFAAKAAGGDITLDGKSIARLLDIMERAGTTQLEGHQKRLEKVYPDANKYSRERAVFGVDMPPPVMAPPPGAPQAGPVVTPDRSALEAEMRRRGLLK